MQQNNIPWLTVNETAQRCRIHPVTLRRYCAERRINAKCGKKVGGKWLFKASVIEDEGLILDPLVEGGAQD